MKNFFKLTAISCQILAISSFASCDKDSDSYEPQDYIKKTIGFENAPSEYFGGPTAYGANLYDGAEKQITKGYITYLHDEAYAQFSVNYGYNWDASFGESWCYTFYNGGIVLSDWHDMEDDSYMNQLSVYSTYSPSGKTFAVANGYAYDIIDGVYKLYDNPSKAIYKNYDKCGRIYITDSKGYGVSKIGQEGQVSGEDEEVYFRSLYINNTTYSFLSMKNGNTFSAPLNEENEGWFKVQFIAFEDDDPNDSPLGYTEVYLANFKKGQANDYIGIVDEWIQVDLSMLPECSILVINFVGSNTGDFGLNTPAYCAIDKIEVEVEK